MYKLTGPTVARLPTNHRQSIPRQKRYCLPDLHANGGPFQINLQAQPLISGASSPQWSKHRPADQGECVCAECVIDFTPGSVVSTHPAPMAARTRPFRAESGPTPDKCFLYLLNNTFGWREVNKMYGVRVLSVYRPQQGMCCIQVFGFLRPITRQF